LKQISHKLIRILDQILQTAYSAQIRNSINDFHRNNILYPADELVFVHLPKTGGTTVASLLRTNNIKCTNLNSHNPVSQATSITNQKYITFLRDPVERVYSYYHMQLRDRSQPYHFLAKRGLIHFLENCWEVRNQACRYYSGFIQSEPSKYHCEIALNNLDQFFFVGTFKNFEMDLKKLLKRLGYSSDSIPNLKKFPKREIEPWESECIKAFNELDILLQKKIHQDEN